MIYIDLRHRVTGSRTTMYRAHCTTCGWAYVWEAREDDALEAATRHRHAYPDHGPADGPELRYV